MSTIVAKRKPAGRPDAVTETDRDRDVAAHGRDRGRVRDGHEEDGEDADGARPQSRAQLVVAGDGDALGRVRLGGMEAHGRSLRRTAERAAASRGDLYHSGLHDGTGSGTVSRPCGPPLLMIHMTVTGRHRPTRSVRVPIRKPQSLFWYARIGIRTARSLQAVTGGGGPWRTTGARCSAAAAQLGFSSKEDALAKSLGVLEPGQDPVLDRRGHPSGHRPPRGVLHLRHVGQAAASTSTSTAAPTTWATATPSWSRPSTAGDAATSTSETTTSRRWLRTALAEALVSTAPRGADQGGLRQRRRGGDRHRHQDGQARDERRKIVSIVKAYHGHTGLAVAAGDDRFSKLFLADRPTSSAVPFNDLTPWRGASRARRGRGDHGDDPRDVRLPDAGARIPGGVKRLCERTARSTSPTRCRQA